VAPVPAEQFLRHPSQQFPFAATDRQGAGSSTPQVFESSWNIDEQNVRRF
jgi:hypothetical protein